MTTNVDIRRPTLDDRDEWMRLRRALWPDCDPPTCLEEMRTILAATDQLALLAFVDDRAVGFAEFSIHPHAPGCHTMSVGYLEGWWVDVDHRRTGVGGVLVRRGEDWARAMGCREMASDTWIENVGSDAAHRALGFEETDRLIHYRRTLESG
ncbi:MAG: GNAT family N-acetyltransferase [Phycisphaerales bacterium]|nr:GNAT family N-acetyltransferase [Phycisphaerales bacterium]